MAHLDASTLRQLISLLAPLMQTPTERRTLLALALGGSHPLLNRLDFDQPTESFVVEMSTRLAAHGALPDGTLAVWALLLMAREQVGSDRAAEIDSLYDTLHAPQELGPQIDAFAAAPQREHIFVSYSRTNTAFVARLIADLQAQGLPVWIDKQGLKPGTRNWENALREAIQRSLAVVLVASPASRKSDYVQDELAIAEMYHRPVYPLWAEGDQWIDSIPMGMGKMQYVDGRDNRYAETLPHLVAALRSVITDAPIIPPPPIETVTVDPASIVNPYKGLQAFTGEDAGYFFGRDTFVNELFDHLKATQTPGASRLLAVIGASGSGKSSVVMAGLLPRLQQGALPHSEDWLYLERVLPGGHPLEGLTDKLVKGGAGRLADIEEYLRHPNARGLHRVVENIEAPRVVLFVDQFEEVFTQTTSEEERRQFLDLLATAVTEPNGKLIVILTLRADFYDRPLNYAEFGKLLDAQSLAIVPMSLADLYDAVQKPAAAVGLTFDEGLVGEIVFDVRDQAGALPLLQFTLDQLYGQRAGQRLTRDAYQTMGGVRGALKGHAEAVYQALPTEDHRKLARALFLRLIEPGATEADTTRRRAALSELNLSDAQRTAMYQIVAQQFVTARLLTTDRIGTIETIEISHEALIREWDRLGVWLRDARDDVRLQKSLSSDVAEWLRRSQPDDMLYRGTVFEDAQRWMRDNEAAVNEQAFIERSSAVQEQRREEDQRIARRVQRLGRAVAGFAVMGVLAIALTIYAFVQTNQAQQALDGVPPTLNAVATEVQAAQNFADSIQLAARAQDVYNSQNQPLGVALAMEASYIDDSPQTERILSELAYAPGFRRRFEGHGDAVISVAFSPDGTQLVSGSWDQTLILWDTATGALLRRFLGHSDVVTSVAFSPDGRQLVSGSEDKTLILWDSATGVLLRRFEGHSSYITSVAFSPDGTQLVSVSWDETLMLWDSVPGAQLRRFEGHSAAVLDVAFSPDGTQLVSSSLDSTLMLWDSVAGAPLRRFEGHSNAVLGMAFSPDATQLVSSSLDSTVMLWDSVPGALLRRFEGHSNAVLDVAFSPDGTQLVSGSYDKTLILWDTATGVLLRRSEGHSAAVWGVAFSPDGSQLVSSSADKTLILWDSATGALLRRFEGHSADVTSVAFSPDGRQLVSGSYDRTLILWDSATGELLRRFEGHTDNVTSVAFSPDGTQIVSGSKDKTLILWDIATGALLRRIEGHSDRVTSAAFSPDGTQLVSGSEDKTLILWRNDRLEQLQAWIHANRYMPELTCTQRASYNVLYACVSETPLSTPTLAPTRTPFPPPTAPQVTFTPLASPTASHTPSITPTATP